MPFLLDEDADSVTKARKLMRSGEFDRCIELLDQLPQDISIVFLRARVLLRQGRHADAIDILSPVREHANPLQQPELQMLLGAAHAYKGELLPARDYLAASAEGMSEFDPLRFELAYHSGLTAWALHDTDVAVTHATTLESSTEATHKGLGTLLRAWLEIREQRVKSGAKLMLQALDHFERSSTRDDFYIARTLFSLAAICRDAALPAVTRRLRHIVARARWTPNLTLDHFQLTRCLGWIDALEGNELAAFRSFKQSARLAPSTTWKIVTLLDRAKLARSSGEEAFAQDQLHEAHALASEVRWSETHNEERYALLILAELFASTEPKIATAYLEKFRSLPPVDANLAYASDRRVKAFAAYSAGIAYNQLGNGASALAALTDAWETFEQYSYGWRSASAAAAIYELTGARTWLTRAQHAIAPWPNSWIARKIAKLDAEKLPTARLTSTQRRVFDALLAGDSTKEIASRLGRSPNTIRNHIAAVFIAFRVKSRAQLLSSAFALSTLNSAQQAASA